MNQLTNYKQDVKEVNENDHKKVKKLVLKKKNTKKDSDHKKEAERGIHRKDRNERGDRNNKNEEGKSPKDSIKGMKNPHDAAEKHFEDDKTGMKGSPDTKPAQPVQINEQVSSKTEFNDDERLEYVPGESETTQANDEQILLQGHDKKTNHMYL